MMDHGNEGVLVCIHDYWMIGNKLEVERELFSGM